MKAAFEASITHTKKRGTVLVVCDDASGARSCGDYLKSFFTDQPQLALLAKKVSSDEIQLSHGTKIVVTTDRTRRPRDLLSSIRLTAGAVQQPVELKSNAEIARDLCHIFLIESRNEVVGPIALNAAALLLKAMGRDDDPEAWIRLWGRRDVGRDEMRWAEWRAAQKGLHAGSSLEGLDQFQQQPATSSKTTTIIMKDGVPYYAPEEEARMRDAREKASMHVGNDPRPLTGPRKRR